MTNLSAQTTVDVIPRPNSIVNGKGTFSLSSSTTINCGHNLERLGQYFSEQAMEFTKLSPRVTHFSVPLKKNSISLELTPKAREVNAESYVLTVLSSRIVLKAKTEVGLFRGIQTLLQLLPVADSNVHANVIRIPCCKIVDHPRFVWRGLNLDCCRHFMTKDFIKRYIDLLAYYKFNVLHWHLTDDQGWRIEIKKYPKLTEVGAWRKEADGTVYGGYYTQEDVKEIVAYARSRFITIIPEIEMPGHCMASLAAYPQNSCTGGPFEVGTQWGVYKDVYCAGKDSTFTFLENILKEVMKLFPSKYIHIGGDEVPKDRWKVCPFCQQRMRTEGLKNEQELQSYFIKRIEKFVESRGREIIGWDEILEGGLARGAVVQSWRGFDGAIQAARARHRTIVSPGDYTYMDRSVDDLSLDTVYSFDPIPVGLTAEQQRYVLGTEANMWTERAPQETIDSKLFPRLLALSEVCWTEPQSKSYEDFHKRLQIQYERLAYLGVDYGLEKRAILFKTKFEKDRDAFIVMLTPAQRGVKIVYTLDGAAPTLNSHEYSDPISMTGTSRLIAQARMNGRLVGDPIELSFISDKAVNSLVTVKNPYSERYTAGGINALVDGIRGTMNFRDGLWQGYEGVDFDAQIDLGEQKEISEIGAGFYQATSSWIFMPDSVEFFVSNDAVHFDRVGTERNVVPQKDPDPVRKDFTSSFDKREVRYVRIIAKNIGACPPWHPGAGGKAWLFIDEVFVR